MYTQPFLLTSETGCKEKAHFEIRTVLDSNHADNCGCEPCKTVREILRRKLTVDNGLFQQVED